MILVCHVISKPSNKRVEWLYWWKRLMANHHVALDSPSVKWTLKFESYLDKYEAVYSIRWRKNYYMRSSSIKELSLFLIFVNDLHKVANYLHPIMFSTILTFFYSNKNVKHFSKSLAVNENLSMNKCRLSLNAKKYVFSMSDSVPLQLPTTTLSNTEI